MGRTAWVPLAALLLAGTAARADDIAARYTCSDGTKVLATFHTKGNAPGSVTLTLPKTGQTLTLPQTVSADGGRYAAGDTVFWSKGTGATFTRGGHDLTCQSKR